MSMVEITDLNEVSTLGVDDQLFVRQGGIDVRLDFKLANAISYATMMGYTFKGLYTTSTTLTTVKEVVYHLGKLYAPITAGHTTDPTTNTDPTSDTALIVISVPEQITLTTYTGNGETVADNVMEALYQPTGVAGGAKSITTPSAANAAFIMHIDSGADCDGTNTVTVNAATGYTIEGDASLIFDAAFQRLSLRLDGTNYRVFAGG